MLKTLIYDKSIFAKIPSWVKYLIAFAPVVFIFWKWHISLSAVFDTCRGIAWWTVPSLIVILFAAMFLNGVKWWMLMRAFIPDLPFPKTMSYHFIGVFYSIVLPSSLGQDVVRTVLVTRKADYAVGWGATWVCKILGFLAMVILALYGLLTVDKKLLPAHFREGAALAVALILLMFYLSFSKSMTRYFRFLFSKIMPKKIMTVLEKIRDGIYLFRNKGTIVLVVFAITLAVQFMLILSGCLIAKGITGKLFLPEFLAFIPLIEMTSLSFPLTPSGTGVREALTAIMLRTIGLSSGAIGAFLLVQFFFSLITRLLGGVPLLYGLIRRPRGQ